MMFVVSSFNFVVFILWETKQNKKQGRDKEALLPQGSAISVCVTGHH
jgi:hypothetical protein